MCRRTSWPFAKRGCTQHKCGKGVIKKEVEVEEEQNK